MNNFFATSTIVRLAAVMALFALFGLMTTTAEAQDNIETTLTAEPAQATVGDPIQLSLTITHPTGYLVILPEMAETWGSFTIAGQSLAETIDNGDTTSTTTQIIDARLFAPGDYQTPPLLYSITDGTGQLFEFMAAPVDVSISSVLIEGDTELRDIKPQAEIPFANLLPWLAGLAFLALLGAGLIWWRRRPVAVELDTRLPHEKALDELAHIESLNLPSQASYNAHYTLTSNCVRRYMGEAYGLPALERTTAEIHRDLQQSSIAPDVQRMYINLLQDSDLVKFADIEPTDTEAGQLVARARLIVEATRPEPGEGENNDPQSGGSHGVTPVAEPSFSANGQSQSTEVKI